jgi:hypothetical protein
VYQQQQAAARRTGQGSALPGKASWSVMLEPEVMKAALPPARPPAHESASGIGGARP